MKTSELIMKRYAGIDFLDPVLMANPYPMYERILNETPLFWSDRLHSLVMLSYEAVSATYRTQQIGGMPRFPQPGMEELNRVIGNWLLDKLPPEHTRVRKAYNPHFIKESIAVYEEPFREIALQLLREASRRGEFDFVKEFARPFPARAMSYMLGCPLEDGEMMADWAESLYFCIGATRYNNSMPHLLRAKENTLKGVSYFLTKIREKRNRPGEDLISRLLPMSDGSEERDYAVASELLLMITAGYITSRDQFGNGMLALLRHPDQFRSLVADRGLIAQAVEEILRYDSALHAPGHFAGEDLEIMGFPLKKGESVVTVIGAANRDPDFFDNPAAFDIFREVNPHIAFAVGHHSCLGANLFRMEAKVVFESIVELMPHARLSDAGKAEYQNFSLLIRGLETLPLKTGS